MNQDKTELCLSLNEVLHRAAKLAGPYFSGIGVIVVRDAEILRTFPIGPPTEIDIRKEPAKLLSEIANLESPYHDGFHILTPTLQVCSLSQYFSPTVIPDLKINRERVFGGRYLAALFGSKIDAVLATGIATRALGTIVFCDGEEVSATPLS